MHESRRWRDGDRRLETSLKGSFVPIADIRISHIHWLLCSPAAVTRVKPACHSHPADSTPEEPARSPSPVRLSGSHVGGDRRNLRYAHRRPQSQCRQRSFKLRELGFMVKVENAPHLAPIDAEQFT